MRTNLPVEQRIEMARKQQAARAAARLDREQARITKEIERNERQEQARREREARSQQILEVSFIIWDAMLCNVSNSGFTHLIHPKTEYCKKGNHPHITWSSSSSCKLSAVFSQI